MGEFWTIPFPATRSKRWPRTSNAVGSALIRGKDSPDDQHFPRTVGLTFVAYHPGRVFCEQTNKDTDRLVFYGEPTPESIGE